MKDELQNNSNTFFNNHNAFGTLDNKNEYAFRNIPLGLSMAFTQNAAAMTVFENMDDEKRRMVIERASKVQSKKEMNKLVQDISMNNF